MPTLIDDYKGAAGRVRLIEALERQELLSGDSAAIAQIADAVTVEAYERDESIITQQGDGDDLFFILEGQARICAQKRTIRIRKPRTHVGDMAMIDPEAKRSADVIALERTVVARLEGSRAREIANGNGTFVWRSLARILADRLRQHVDGIRQQNEIPVIFIGSTSEALPVAQAFKRALAGNWATTMVWNDDGFFPASLTAIESLEKRIREIDFAVFVAGDDDVTTSRNQSQVSPRDNIVFEIGLAMGAIGRSRTFVVTPRLGRGTVKWPSDLFGVNFVFFDPPPPVKAKWFWSKTTCTSYNDLEDTQVDELVSEAARTLIDQMKQQGPY